MERFPPANVLDLTPRHVNQALIKSLRRKFDLAMKDPEFAARKYKYLNMPHTGTYWHAIQCVNTTEGDIGRFAVEYYTVDEKHVHVYGYGFLYGHNVYVNAESLFHSPEDAINSIRQLVKKHEIELDEWADKFMKETFPDNG